MGNRKLWLASIEGTSLPQPAGGKNAETGCTSDLLHGLRPDEGVRLIRAFSRIPDPALRAQLIEFVEKYARK